MSDYIDSPEERLREVAILRSVGITRIYPVGADKKPLGKWARGKVNHVLTPADDAQVDTWMREYGRSLKGWANLCGDKGAAIGTLDVELPGLDRYPEVIWPVLKGLPDQCQVPSQHGGQHAVFRITDGDPVPTSQVAKDGDVLLVETRGVSKKDKNGAYAVVTGPGRGRLPDDFAPAEMTRAEFEAVVAPIRALHKPSDKAQKVRANKAKAKGNKVATGTGKVLAEAVTAGTLTWPQILDPGWAEAGDDGDRVEYLRPLYGDETEDGRKSTASANWTRSEGPVLCVWSGSVPWADPGDDGFESLNPAQALAAARFDGDFGAAMRAVEAAAEVCIITGELTAPCETWDVDVLEDVHAQRKADREQYEQSTQQADEEKSDPTATATRRLQLVSFADITERVIDWLVPGLIPRAEVVIALGQEGIGKGLWWCHLLGRVTTGPDAIDVVVIVAEDSPDATVLPRLKAVGADLSRVHLITLDPETYTGVPTIPGNSAQVADLIRQAGASLVVVDPWLSIVPGGLRVSDTQQARQALDPVTRLARETGAAFVLVTHTNRMASPKARDLYGATVALRQAGRVCVMAVQDPADDDVLYVGVEKSNIMRAAPASKYRKVGTVGTAAWMLEDSHEHVGLTIGELVDLFAQVEDGRATDRWTEVAVLAAQNGGLITRAQVIEVYADAGDAAKAADKAIARWRNTEPPRLTPVKGERGVFEVAGIGQHSTTPRDTPHYPPTSDMGGMGGKEGETPRTPRNTNGGLAGGSGGFDPRLVSDADHDPWTAVEEPFDLTGLAVNR